MFVDLRRESAPFEPFFARLYKPLRPMTVRHRAFVGKISIELRLGVADVVKVKLRHQLALMCGQVGLQSFSVGPGGRNVLLTDNTVELGASIVGLLVRHIDLLVLRVSRLRSLLAILVNCSGSRQGELLNLLLPLLTRNPLRFFADIGFALKLLGLSLVVLLLHVLESRSSPHILIMHSLEVGIHLFLLLSPDKLPFDLVTVQGAIMLFHGFLLDVHILKTDINALFLKRLVALPEALLRLRVELVSVGNGLTVQALFEPLAQLFVGKFRLLGVSTGGMPRLRLLNLFDRSCANAVERSWLGEFRFVRPALDLGQLRV